MLQIVVALIPAVRNDQLSIRNDDGESWTDETRSEFVGSAMLRYLRIMASLLNRELNNRQLWRSTESGAD